MVGVPLSWVLSPQSQGVNPVHPCEPLDHEIWLSLVVQFQIGEGRENSQEEGRKGREVTC